MLCSLIKTLQLRQVYEKTEKRRPCFFLISDKSLETAAPSGRSEFSPIIMGKITAVGVKSVFIKQQGIYEHFSSAVAAHNTREINVSTSDPKLIRYFPRFALQKPTPQPALTHISQLSAGATELSILG